MSTGRGDDVSMYRGILDPRFRFMPHDLDTCFEIGDTSGALTRNIFSYDDSNTPGTGVVGLTRALTYAGAHNILVSLWKVNDASTAELMISFYKALLQRDEKKISSALREAKLAMIKDRKFSDPYYWSPFVLLGW